MRSSLRPVPRQVQRKSLKKYYIFWQNSVHYCTPHREIWVTWSPRAQDVLRQVDTIACEIPGRPGLPCSITLKSKKPLLSFHAHNEHKRLQALTDLLRESAGCGP